MPKEKKEIIEPEYEEIKERRPVEEIPFHKHKKTDGSPPISYKDLEDKSDIITRTAISLDLSGGAITLVCFHTEKKAELINAYLLYTEASSADAGVTIRIGKEADAAYYYTGTSEVSKSLWYSKKVDLLKRDIEAGDTVLFSTVGGKVGTGEIMLIIEYKIL